MQSHVHAENSAKRFGGVPNDYIKIHEIMDSSKKAFPDLRHRALTHHQWFITEILERIFGLFIINSAKQRVAVRLIGQWHIMEDYHGAHPSAQDFLQEISFQPWMDNGNGGTIPPSNKGLPPFDLKQLEPMAVVPKEKKVPKLKKIKTPLYFKDFFHPEEEESSGCRGSGRID